MRRTIKKSSLIYAIAALLAGGTVATVAIHSLSKMNHQGMMHDATHSNPATDPMQGIQCQTMTLMQGIRWTTPPLLTRQKPHKQN
ncbi:MAG: hypothetical protein KME06_04440 [Kastovskya adunca ATA6-11-RM4]|nr:hypothetical protein [Kastovskya adunca ATA6-11-RM4]